MLPPNRIIFTFGKTKKVKFGFVGKSSFQPLSFLSVPDFYIIFSVKITTAKQNHTEGHENRWASIERVKSNTINILLTSGRR